MSQPTWQPDYDFDPFEGWIGDLISTRDSTALMVRNDLMEWAFAILALHIVGSFYVGAKRGESFQDILVGRIIFAVTIFELYRRNYFSFFGPLALMFGSLGPRISGIPALDPIEVLVQGIDAGLEIFTWSTLISVIAGDGGWLTIGALLVTVAAHFYLALQIAICIIETVLLYIGGPFLFSFGMSAWTFGAIMVYLRLSLELGIRIFFFHVFLKVGNDGTLRVLSHYNTEDFFSLRSLLMATSALVLLAVMSGWLPKKLSEAFAGGIVNDLNWGNPFALNLQGSKA